MILTGRVWFLLLICVECNIFKFHVLHSAFEFSQNITTNPISSCCQGMNLVLRKTLPQQIFMQKCTNNGNIRNSTLWKGNTDILHVPQAVLFTLTNEMGIYHGGELDLREFHTFQVQDYNGITQLHEYTFTKHFYLQSSDVKLLRQIACVFGDTASNSNEVDEIYYRVIVIFFFFNLPWTCIFTLLL